MSRTPDPNEQHPIRGCPGYFITRRGAVWSHRSSTPRRLSTPPHPTHGYHTAYLRVNGASKSFLLHRLLAIAFIPNPEKLPEVNHKDLNRRNNDLSNLEWVTTKENAVHAARNYGSANGKHRPRKKRYVLNDDLVREIRRRYAEGETQTALANEFGYTQGALQRVIHEDLWNWVDRGIYQPRPKKRIQRRGTGPTGNSHTAPDSEAHHRIPGYPDYRATASGVIWSYKRSTPSMMTPGTNNDGYLITTLRNRGRSYTELVHRLVALALIPNPKKLPQVNHRNLNKQDNRSSNLEWATHKQNTNHSAAIWGREDPAAKPAKKQYKLNDKLVADIRRRSATGAKAKDLEYMSPTSISSGRGGTTSGQERYRSRYLESDQEHR